MNLFIIPIYQIGGFADALGIVFGDRLQQLQILRAEESTEFSVRSDVEDRLRIVELFTLLGCLDTAARALIEAVAFADRDFER